MDDSVGLLYGSGSRVALADDVLVVVAQHGEQLEGEVVDGDLTLPVSYTHLTLPTKA